MYRQLLRQEPEVIAVIAQNEDIFKRWQNENDFYDLPSIKWRYIRGRHSVMGMQFTMLLLIDDWYRLDGVGKLIELVQRQLDRGLVSRARTFTTEEMWKGKYKYRKIS